MNSPFISINNVLIGNGKPPYIIAEMSANHNGKIENAFDIIRSAKECGVSAVKIQTYKPDTITLDCTSEEFKVSGGLWHGRTLYDLYNEAHLPWEWHKPIFDYARKLGITIFSTPFDKTAVDLLEDLDVPAYKIASFEIVDLPLIKYVAKTKKPMIISTGMASAIEIEEAIECALEGGAREIAVLHCVSAYPAPYEDCNLKTIPDMIKRYGLVTGLSDHTLTNIAAIAAIALGASLVEKHFTLNRDGGGPDDSFSLDPLGMADLCTAARATWASLGSPNYDLLPSEVNSAKFRRSLYYTKDMIAGEVITEESMKSVRPGYGLPPKFYYRILGRKVGRNVKKNQPISESDLIG